MLAIFIMTFTSMMSNFATADDGFYASFAAGPNWVSKDRNHHNGFDGRHDRKNNVGYFVAGALGYNWCWCENQIRTELEVAYRNNQHKNHHSDDDGDDDDRGHHNRNRGLTSVMVNAFYDIDICSCITPYVGGGIGVGIRNNDDHRRGGDGDGEHRHCESRAKFAGQLIVGASYALCDNIALTLDYRYFKVAQRNVHHQDIGVGLRYSF